MYEYFFYIICWIYFFKVTDYSYIRYPLSSVSCLLALFFIYLLFKFIYLFNFIIGCVGSSPLCTGFLQLRRAGATLRCGARASHCSGLSRRGARAPGAWASVVVARGLSSCGSRALECRLSSCGARAQLLRGMWDLPRPGLEPMSPALAGGLLTTAPPGKPLSTCFNLSLSTALYCTVIKLEVFSFFPFFLPFIGTPKFVK